jgi:hypothetical protein
MRIFFSLLFFILSFSQGWADASAIQMDLFVSSTCPHCQKVEAFFAENATKMPWLHINKYVINQDKVALELFSQRLSGFEHGTFMVPALFFCGSHWVAFDTATQSGKPLLQALQYCKNLSNADGSVSEITKRVLQQKADASFAANTLQKQNYSPTQHLLLAFVEGLNVCSLFFFAAFIALLGREKHYQGQLSTGLACMVAYLLIHCFQQYYYKYYLILLPWLRLPTLVVTALMLTYLLRNLKSTKTYILVVFFFGLAILAYQQSCASSLGQGTAAWLYNILYLLPLLICLLVYILVARTSWVTAKQTLLNRLSFYVLSAIALCLIIYPYGLANPYLSLLLLPLVVGGWYWGRKPRGI